MTLADLLAELPALGPWGLRGPTGILRNGSGDCPLQAAARRRGRVVVVNLTPLPTERIAVWLGMDVACGRAVADAADNLPHAMRRWGAGDDDGEVVRLEAVRTQLIEACGL